MKSITKILFILFLCCTGILTSKAQTISLGPQAGMYQNKYTTQTPVNNLLITANGGSERQLSAGIFAEYQGKWVGLRTEINYYHLSGPRFSITNPQDIAHSNKYSFAYTDDLEIPLTFNFYIPLYKEMQLALFGGAATTFHFSGKKTAHEFQGIPEVQEVANALQETAKPLTFNYLYGARLDIWRMFISIQGKRLLSDSFTDDLKAEGETYDLITKESWLQYKVGYRFYLKK